VKGAKIIIECLIEQGVQHVFGYPGGAVLDIFDELYLAKDRINQIMTSHEQGAAHAADGYARVSGKTGVVIATSGPGATNLVTGIATAYMDSIPVVAITGNVGLPLIGRDSFQEVDITGITMPVTKHNFIVKDVKDLASTIRRAFEIAQSGRPGPVLIDVPKNIQQADCDFVNIPRATPKTSPLDKCATAQLSNIAQLLKSCSKPLIYLGGGAVTSGANAEVIKLAETIGAPVTCSLMGLGGFPSSHPNAIGMIGMHGHKGVMKAVSECDALIVLGARFSDRVMGNRETFAPNAKIVHIDIDPAEVGKNIQPDEYITGDVKTILKKLYPLLDGMPSRGAGHWADKIANQQIAGSYECKCDLDPRLILQTIKKYSPPERVVATDVGQHQMWTAQSYKFERPRTFVTSGGLGTMGFGMGASIGSCFGQAYGKKPNSKGETPYGKTVLITGDGSFHMNLNELATISKNNLPVKIFLLDNSVLGMVRQWQKLFYDRRFSSTTPTFPTRHDLLAKAFGIKYEKLESNDKVDEVVKRALSHKKPVLIHCKISCDDNVLPMIPPGKGVKEIITDFE